MQKKQLSIIILLFISAVSISAAEKDANRTSFVLGGYISTDEYLKSDRNLDFTSVGLRTFLLTDWGLRYGGFLDIALSSRDVTEENPYLYGGLFGGAFAGLELDLSAIVISINCLLGAGGSSSNIESGTRHFDFCAEINTDAGFVISNAFGISAYGGYRCIGNLFPQLPGTAYFLYFPVWGLVFTF